MIVLGEGSFYPCLHRFSPEGLPPTFSYSQSLSVFHLLYCFPPYLSRICRAERWMAGRNMAPSLAGRRFTSLTSCWTGYFTSTTALGTQREVSSLSIFLSRDLRDLIIPSYPHTASILAHNCLYPYVTVLNNLHHLHLPCSCLSMKTPTFFL